MKKQLILMILLWSPRIFAQDLIVREWSSPRNTAMGNVRLTTGIYEENFFNNPARVTDNPESKFSLIGISGEINANVFPLTQTTLNTNNILNKLKESTGENFHARLQTSMPAYYLTTTEHRDWAFAIGLFNSIQSDITFRNSYQLDFQTIADLGPAITLGKKFFQNKSLSIGLTGHLHYRLSINPEYSIIQYVENSQLSLSSLAGDGIQFNADLGITYKLKQFKNFNIQLAFASQNIFDNMYQEQTISLLKNNTAPIKQTRSYGFGILFQRPTFLMFSNNLFAIEITDISNNNNGSIFKLIHTGCETTLGPLSFRLGLNQGYLSAGLGLNLKVLTLDLSTYSEELGLNAGQIEDRRYALSLTLNSF